ncbi:MAG: hypothetical protein KDE33_01425, partial [Bacteroidetes bacterium]|nr:hypothetical protein [Bacteroidota bacterium]
HKIKVGAKPNSQGIKSPTVHSLERSLQAENPTLIWHICILPTLKANTKNAKEPNLPTLKGDEMKKKGENTLKS